MTPLAPASRCANVSVVICAYTEERWDELLAAIASVRAQTVPVRETILVIDNNPQLLARARAALPDIKLLDNNDGHGAGTARNKGVAAASGSVIAFLDDDATASVDWVAYALEALQSERVLGVGGTLLPVWEGKKPAWLPEEFYWVVGCSYRGLPTNVAPVRNLIAANMLLRRDVFVELEGFRPGFGKTGRRSGTEETELCIRANQTWPNKVWLHDPAVAVLHRVPGVRTSIRYFISRCYDEGVAKASVVSFVGANDALAAERRYTSHVLPSGILGALARAVRHRDLWALARGGAIVLGLSAAVLGYARGRLAGLWPDAQ